MTVSELLEKMSSNEISEWMAYDLTKDEKFRKKAERELKAERSKHMTKDEIKEEARNFFRSFIDGNKCKFSSRNKD